MFSLRFDSIDLGEGYVRGAHIRLVAGIKGHAGGNSVNVEQQVAFAVDIPSTPSHAILNEWIRPLQDFLILALGRPVRLTNLRLRPTKAALHDDMVRVSFEAIQPAPGPTASWSAIMSYTAPTLLTFADSPISFGDLLPRWFELRSELSEVFVLLHAPYYAPFMFSEHRYSSTFQSAEALAHARGFAGREKPRKEHEKRVDSIVSAARGSGVDENDVQWAERVLQSRNDKPLAQQIHDLVASTGAIGESVLAACPAFGEVAAASRTGVSHPGTPKRIDAVERHGYADVLRWIVRARALMDLGISTEEVERRVLQRAGFQDALGSIRKDEL